MDFPSKSVTVRPLRHQFLWIVFGSTEQRIEMSRNIQKQ